MYCQEMPLPVNRPRRFTPRRLAPVLCAALIGLAVTGCEETVDVRGNLPHASTLKEIKPGVQKRSDIQRLLGTPSAVSTFDKEVWYYIGGRVKTVSFFKPEVLERKVVTVRFTDKGVVENIDVSDAPTEKQFELVERETPTKGRELTFLQQLIGNVGRINQNRKEDPYYGK
jgi:outer membrane protein assembly factor BamE (lipoprotein component of BamABCDE complex)